MTELNSVTQRVFKEHDLKDNSLKEHDVKKQGLAVVGFSMIEANCGLSMFAANGLNAWEKSLYQQAKKVSGKDIWLFNRFGMNGETNSYRNANYREALNSLSHACKNAFSEMTPAIRARIRKGKTALVYFDSWGETSMHEAVNSWRDSISVDMLPKSIARDYSVQDFSFKVRGERNGFLQAFRMASDLLNSETVDSVILCGLHRGFPVLVFSETTTAPAAKTKTPHHDGNSQYIIERVGCMVLRKEQNAERYLALSDYFTLSDRQKPDAHLLAEKWQDLITRETSTIYGANTPWGKNLFSEQLAIKQMPPGIHYQKICTTYGDSGCMNPMSAIHGAFNQTSVGESGNNHCIISAGDGQKGMWLLECWQEQVTAN